MSGILEINFAADMPAAVVEVIGPNLDTVGRVWVDPSGSAKIDVPSEDSFLRVHLPSGQVVTVNEGRGQLRRQISLANLQRSTEQLTLPDLNVGALEAGQKLKLPDLSVKSFGAGKNLREVRSLYQTRALPISEPGTQQFAPPPETITPQFRDGTQVQLVSGRPLKGIEGNGGEEIFFRPFPRERPCELNVTGSRGHLRVQLPGMLREVYARLDKVDDRLHVVTIRVATMNNKADCLMGYMARGDLSSAASLVPWADRAEDMLQEKMADPFAATVGAYLLLRLRRFDLMRTWARNLADRWPDFADGHVIWAWQLIHQREPHHEEEIRSRLETAIAAGLPIFSEGLNLLRDGLRLLGPEAKDHLQQLNSKIGLVICDSPFTAGVLEKPSTTDVRTQFEIGYLPSA